MNDASLKMKYESLVVHFPSVKDVGFYDLKRARNYQSYKLLKVIESKKYYVVCNIIALSRVAEVAPVRYAVRKVNVGSMSKQEETI